MSLIILVAVAAAVAAVAGVGIAFAVGATAVAKNNKERNQVVPGEKSAAPANWSGSHEREAKLHRRLRDAVAGLHTIAANDPSLSSTVAAVDKDALDIDHQLVAASLLAPRFKEQALNELAEAVEQLEEIAAHAVGSSTRVSERSVREQLEDLSDRLKSMRLARAEVDEADRRGQTGEA